MNITNKWWRCFGFHNWTWKIKHFVECRRCGKVTTIGDLRRFD